MHSGRRSRSNWQDAMTSVQTMLKSRCRVVPSLMALAVVFTWVGVLTCASGCGPQLQDPVSLNSPHLREQLWAILPPANESGVSLVETDRIADMFAREMQQVVGINVIPVNRMLRTMRELRMDAIETAGDARTLLNALQADGLIIGAVTAWEPYPPMTLGLAVEFYAGERIARMSALDTIALTRAATDRAAPGMFSSDAPVSQVAGVFDASNHQTLARLERYADGRSTPDSAYGADIYLVSMDMYTRFVSFCLLEDLLRREQLRLGLAEANESVMDSR